MVSDLTEPMLLKYAVEIGLDEFDFEQCLESDASRDAVTKDREEALTLKLSSLPVFILDGRMLLGTGAAGSGDSALDGQIIDLYAIAPTL